MTQLTVSGLFGRAATRTPSRCAISDGVQDVSYGELATHVHHVAEWMRGPGGLQHGDRVLIISSNSPAYLVAVLACASAGVVSVPVGTQLTEREVVQVVLDCGPRLILHDAEHEAIAEAASKQADTYVLVRDCSSIGTLPAADADVRGEWPAPRGQDILYLGYTSGTTGAPRGMAVSHANRTTAILLQAVEFGLGRSDTHLVVSPLYHTAPLTFVLLHLCLGGTVIVRPGFDAHRVATEFCAGRATNTFLAPAALQRVLDQLMSFEDGVSDRMRAVVIGGSPCPTHVKTTALDVLPHRLFEFYGATEVGIVSVLRPEEQADRPRSAGRLLLGVDVEIRDIDSGALVDAGEPGEVWISTETMASGVFGTPDNVPGEPRHLGDIGYLDGEGFLHLIDRTASIIVRGGVNVYARDVEAVIESHPDVIDVAVLGVADPVWGEAVVALVESRNPDLIELSLAAHCEGSLARYKRPSAFVFVAELPRSATGKIDRKRAKRLYSQISESSADATRG